MPAGRARGGRTAAALALAGTWLLALCLGGCRKAAEPPAEVAARLARSSGVASGECLLAFDNPSRVLGVDGASSVPLDADRVLFTFADTLIGDWNPDGTRRIASMQDSSAMIVRRADASRCFEGTPFLGGTSAKRLFSDLPAADRAYWPAAAVRRGEVLTLFYSFPIRLGDGPLDFALESGVVQGRVEPLEIDGRRGVVAPREEALLGSALLVEGEEAYVYRCNSGSILGGGVYPCVVARTSLATLAQPSTWRYFVAGRGWAGSYAEASKVMEGASEFTVSYNPYLKAYLQIYVEPFSREVSLRTAPAPEGPFGPKRALWKCALPDTEPTSFCYAGKAHPELDREGGRVVAVTYNTNVELERLAGRPELYWPRLVWVALEK